MSTVRNTTGTNNVTLQPMTTQALRGSASDLATGTVALNGHVSQCGHVNGGAAAYSTTTIRNYQSSASANHSTTTATIGTWTEFSADVTLGTGPNIITDFHAFRKSASAFSAATTVITNFYGVRLQAPTLSGGAVITNRYPHAQEDTDGRNYFRSPTFFGSAVGTARSATNPSVEVEAVAGVSNGDVRLRSASAVFDASNSSTNGTKYFARTTGTDLPTTTTQSWYEEGSYTPATTGGWVGTLAGRWTRIGRQVFVTIMSTGSPNGCAAGASTLSLPNGLSPATGRSGAGFRVKTATGSALGNGVVSVDSVSGLIQISTSVTSDNDAKVIQCMYEV